jgi:hypothetical protein
MYTAKLTNDIKHDFFIFTLPFKIYSPFTVQQQIQCEYSKKTFNIERTC